MIREKAIGGRLVQGLRTKYFPKSRINQGLISIGPWVNVLLLIIMFIILGSRLVVQPAYTIDLPNENANMGVQPGLLAVVKHFGAAGGKKAPERVFFEDDSFVLDNDQQMQLLLDKVRAASVRDGKTGLLLFADSEISNDKLLRVFSVFRKAGIESVSLAVSQD